MPHTTEAAVLFETGKPLRCVTLQLPDLKPGQIIVDVAYSGVCHSQLNEVKGLRGPDPFLPHTLGHEGSGTVVEIGDGVTKVKPGDRVVLTWLKGTGADVPSTTYELDGTTVNSGAIGTFMRRTVTCENRVVPMPMSMPLKEAALLGCAIPTGGGIILNTMKVSDGDTVAVFGVGGIGMSAVATAAMKGAREIFAIDVSAGKLDRARALGATHTVNAAETDPLAAIADATGGKGVDYAVEAAGRTDVMEAAFKSVRDGGGLCVLAGNPKKGDLLSIDPFDLIRGKRVVGSWGGETIADHDIPLYAEWFMAGKLSLSPLITHEYALADINDALRDLESGAVGRGLIDMARA